MGRTAKKFTPKRIGKSSGPDMDVEVAPLGTERLPVPRRDRGALLALAVLGLTAGLAYQNSLAGAFVFDDQGWIVDNPSIRDLGSIGRVLLPLNTMYLNSRPLVNLTLALNYAVGGTNAAGYHGVNLAIHLLAALTLFGIVRRTLTSPRLGSPVDPTCRAGPTGGFASAATLLAIAIAALWAVHPLQTQAVTYVIQRCESLMGLLYLLTLYCVIRGAESQRGASQKETVPFLRHPIARIGTAPGLWNLAAVAACVLGMGSKEVMATAPVVVLLYDRTFLSGSFRGALRARYGLYLGLAASWAVVAGLVLAVARYSPVGIAVKTFTWWSYLLTQPGVLVHYLRLAFWPTGLCLDYGWPPARTLAAIVPPGLLIVGLLAWTGWALVKRPALGFLGAWFFLILAPTSSIVPIEDAAVEHRMYLSLAAVVAGVVLGGYLALRRLIAGGWLSARTSAVIGSCSIVLVAIAFAALTRQRNTAYRDEVSIWEDTIAKRPNNPRAYCSLGNAFEHLSKYNEAVPWYRKAIQLKPTFIEARYNLGKVLVDSGRLSEAIAELEAALKIDPNVARVHYTLGLALADSGRTDEAIRHYERALQIDPNFASAHYNLAAALLARSRFSQAADHYRQVLRIEPKSLDACNNLARLLATCPDASVRDGAEALRWAQKAVELSHHQQPLMLDTLAAAYAATGRMAEAIQTDRRAAELAAQQNQASLAELILANIRRYQADPRHRN